MELLEKLENEVEYYWKARLFALTIKKLINLNEYMVRQEKE